MAHAGTCWHISLICDLHVSLYQQHHTCSGAPVYMYICAYVDAHVCLCICALVCMHVEVREHPWELFLRLHSASFFFETKFLMDLELSKQARLSLPPQNWDHKHILPYPAFVLECWFWGLNSDPQKYFTDGAISTAPPCFIDRHTAVVKHSPCHIPARRGLPQEP